MQDLFDFSDTAAASSAAPAHAKHSVKTLAEGLTPLELAWGREVLARYTSSVGRKNWFTALSESDTLRFSAAVFRVARTKREGLRLASLGAPRDSFGWLNADPELALASRVLSSGLIYDGELPLLPPTR